MSLKFGKVIITKKEFYKVREITDPIDIDLDNIVVSDITSAHDGKDEKLIVGYQMEKTIIPLLIKTPKNIVSTGVTQYNENST